MTLTFEKRQKNNFRILIIFIAGALACQFTVAENSVMLEPLLEWGMIDVTNSVIKPKSKMNWFGSSMKDEDI